MLNNKQSNVSINNFQVSKRKKENLLCIFANDCHHGSSSLQTMHLYGTLDDIYVVLSNMQIFQKLYFSINIIRIKNGKHQTRSALAENDPIATFSDLCDCFVTSFDKAGYTGSNITCAACNPDKTTKMSINIYS